MTLGCLIKDAAKRGEDARRAHTNYETYAITNYATETGLLEMGSDLIVRPPLPPLSETAVWPLTAKAKAERCVFRIFAGL